MIQMFSQKQSLDLGLDLGLDLALALVLDQVQNLQQLQLHCLSMIYLRP